MMTVPAHSWSVPVRFENVPEAGLRIDLAADAGVRAALAQAAGVVAVPRIEANFDVRRHGRDGLHVRGRVLATVRQTCVVTLEPLENEIDEPVDLTFMPQQDGGDAHRREEELGAHDPPEALVNGTDDLGAIATEHLIVGVDPNPRLAGTVFAAPAQCAFRHFPLLARPRRARPAFYDKAARRRSTAPGAPPQRGKALPSRVGSSVAGANRSLVPAQLTPFGRPRRR